LSLFKKQASPAELKENAEERVSANCWSASSFGRFGRWPTQSAAKKAGPRAIARAGAGTLPTDERTAW